MTPSAQTSAAGSTSGRGVEKELQIEEVDQRLTLLVEVDGIGLEAAVNQGVGVRRGHALGQLCHEIGGRPWVGEPPPLFR